MQTSTTLATETADRGRRSRGRRLVGGGLVAVAVATGVLSAGAGAAEAASPACGTNQIRNSWDDSVWVVVCLEDLGPASGGGRLVLARTQVGASTVRNPVRTCDARLSVTVSDGSRHDAPPAVTTPPQGFRTCSASNSLTFRLFPGRTAVGHGNSSTSFFLGTYANWYWMNTWEWGGTAHTPAVWG